MRTINISQYADSRISLLIEKGVVPDFTDALDCLIRIAETTDLIEYENEDDNAPYKEEKEKRERNRVRSKLRDIQCLLRSEANNASQRIKENLGIIKECQSILQKNVEEDISTQESPVQEDIKTTDAERSPEKTPSDIARNLFASRLNGREYGKEITKEEIEEAKEKGFVVVYGYSDDNVEFCGALMDEIGAWNGARIAIDNKGVGLYEEESCKYEITALWDGKLDDRLYMKNGYDCHDENEDLIPWTFDTGIPHSTFMIYEDEEPFCRGIVINMEDLK